MNETTKNCHSQALREESPRYFPFATLRASAHPLRFAQYDKQVMREFRKRSNDDSNQFIDKGSEYDVALALRNVFSLAPGASATYTTTTRFGSGQAAQLDITPPHRSRETVSK